MLTISGVDNRNLKLGGRYKIKIENERHKLVDQTKVSEELRRVSCSYSQVKNSHEARCFLQVSHDTILMVKARLLTPSGPTECLLQFRDENYSKNTVEILLRVTAETASESLHQKTDVDSEHFSTHFVQSVTYGRELIVSIKITNCGGVQRDLQYYPKDPDLREVYRKLCQEIEALSTPTSRTTVQCYASGYSLTQNKPSLAQLPDVLLSFEMELKGEDQGGKAVALRYELQPVRISEQLQDFEYQFDDLRAAEEKLCDIWEDKDGDLERNKEFQQNLKELQGQLESVKKEYEKFVRDNIEQRNKNEDDFNSALRKVCMEYRKVPIVGKNDKFVKEINAILDSATKYNPENYTVISEQEWKKLKYRGMSEQKIKEKDDQRKRTIDNTLERNKLQTNRLQRLKSDSQLVAFKSDVNVALIGKDGAGKSSLGNLLAGQSVFKECKLSQTATKIAEHTKIQFQGRSLSIIDTPGLRSMREIMKEVMKLEKSIDVFIYVMNGANRRFNEKEQEPLLQIKKYCPDVMKHMIVVFTHADATAERHSLMEYLESSDPLKAFMEEVSYYVMAVNNKCESEYERQRQKESLMELLYVRIIGNDGKIFTLTAEMVPDSDEEVSELTDDMLLKLSTQVVSENILRKIGIRGLCLGGAAVDRVINNNRFDISAASFALFREWRLTQKDEKEAHKNICSALTRADMPFLINKITNYYKNF